MIRPVPHRRKLVSLAIAAVTAAAAHSALAQDEMLKVGFTHKF
jgi:hypothetical protein